ncbi:MAG TPA: DUF418 domain-containing protein [Acidimicrobiales bacterium]|nr:DUF418 domain-containing protein [Acidimicrobiales bacterium]
MGTNMEMLAAPPRPRVTTRLIGIDAARALAFGGMLLAHFAASRRSTDPGWLQAVDNAADGRAAPLFCLLLGVGAGLLAAKGTSDGGFVRRGLVLFGLGLFVWPFVDNVYLILPHYGILLALFPLVRRMPTRWLLPAAGVAFLLPSLVVATMGDLGLRSAGQPSTYAELLDAPTVLSGLLWTGGYPLIGWAGFVLVGAWVVRLRLGDARTQWALLLGSVAVVAAQPLMAAAYRAFDGSSFLDSVAHSNQTAWYTLAAATSVAVVPGCLIVARRAAAVVRSIVPLGQMALTAYLAHLLVGEMVVFPWLQSSTPSLAVQVAVATAVFAGFALAARAWLAEHGRGPVERVLRTLAG